MSDKLKVTAGFAFTMNEKRAVQNAAKQLTGERAKFGDLWRDFLDGDADAEQVFVWWWASHDGQPDLDLETVGDWGPDDYEVVVPEGESEGEGNAVENGGSTTSTKSSRSSSSTVSPRPKSTTGTTTS